MSPVSTQGGSCAGGEKLPGRYISKRERAAAESAEAAKKRKGEEGGEEEGGVQQRKDADRMASVSSKQVQDERCQGQAQSGPTPLPLPFPPEHISRAMQRRLESGQVHRCYASRFRVCSCSASPLPILSTRWSPLDGSLLASSGSDGRVCIWLPWQEQHSSASAAPSSPSPSPSLVRTFSHHTAAVRQIEWFPDSRFLLSASFDCTAKLLDVESSRLLSSFPHPHRVTSLQLDPASPSLFFSGAAGGGVQLWDTRTGGTQMTLSCPGGGDVLSLALSPCGKHLVTSADNAHTRAMDRGLLVWDMRSGSALSKQIYMEGFTCPWVEFHPSGNSFAAQSNGGYIALFSARAPFKLNKYKRFEGHEVVGSGVRFCFSPDGTMVVSGSASGQAVFFDFRSSQIKGLVDMCSPSACMDVSFHLVLSSTIAGCGWDGSLVIAS